MSKLKVFFLENRNNFLYALVISLVIILGDTIFSKFSETYSFSPKVKYIFAVFLTFYLLSFSRSVIFQFSFSFFIIFMSFIQMAHIQYYGTLIEPLEVWLFFQDMQEVTDVLFSRAMVFVPAVLIFIVSITMVALLIRKNNSKTKKHLFGPTLLILLYLIGPVGALVEGKKFWKGASMDTLTYNATYRALGDFFSRILPRKIMGAHNAGSSLFKPLKAKFAKQEGHIIYVIGESLNFENMQLYGYLRNTTPYLSSLKEDEHFTYKKAISCGLFTSSSVSFLLNATCHERSYVDLVAKENCLFNRAKKQGYKTAFLSGQTFEQLKTIVNFTCPSSIDYSYHKPEESEGPMYDADLLGKLSNLDWKQQQFVVIQLRGSHAPYDQYPQKNNLFSPSSNTRRSIIQSQYDNTVAYTDVFLKQLVKYIKNVTDKPTHIVFTSDHGEQLGKDGKYGHGFISDSVITVPLFHYLINSNEAVKPFSNNQYVSHIEGTKRVLEIMGYSYFPKYNNGEFFTMGADLEAEEGYFISTIHNNKIESQRKELKD